MEGKHIKTELMVNYRVQNFDDQMQHIGQFSFNRNKNYTAHTVQDHIHHGIRYSPTIQNIC